MTGRPAAGLRSRGGAGRAQCSEATLSSRQPCAGEILPQHFLTRCPPDDGTLPAWAEPAGRMDLHPSGPWPPVWRPADPQPSPQSRYSRPPCRSPATARCSQSPCPPPAHRHGCALPGRPTTAHAERAPRAPPGPPQEPWSQGRSHRWLSLSAKNVVQNC